MEQQHKSSPPQSTAPTSLPWSRSTIFSRLARTVTTTTLDFTGNDQNMGGGSLQIEAINGISTLPGNGQISAGLQHGSLQISGFGGTITYTPADTDNATEVITYLVSDGFGNTDTGTVTITIGDRRGAQLFSRRKRPVSIVRLEWRYDSLPGGIGSGDRCGNRAVGRNWSD